MIKFFSLNIEKFEEFKKKVFMCLQRKAFQQQQKLLIAIIFHNHKILFCDKQNYNSTQTSTSKSKMTCRIYRNFISGFKLLLLFAFCEEKAVQRCENKRGKNSNRNECYCMNGPRGLTDILNCGRHGFLFSVYSPRP